MKHIQTFESFLGEGLGVPTANSIIADIKSGMGWATVEYVDIAPLNRAGKIALAQMLAAEGILFADEDLSDKHHQGKADPVKDGIKPMSVADAKKLVF